MRIPRLVVAAPHSGAGKTTVATGLMAALAARGHRVSPHKVGPDYIDPGYHALATGRPGRNLDAYLCGTELIGPLFAHGAIGTDIAVVEGVMGLFDGAVGHGELASTAQVARLLQAPVVLVVDGTSQGRSIAALVGGFLAFDHRIRIAGVVLNRVGSPRHEEILRDAVAETGVSVLGVLPRQSSVAAPSRHLGLIPAAERQSAASDGVAEMAALVERSLDLETIVAVARSAPDLPVNAWDPRSALGDTEPIAPVRIAVAGGSAFTFGYAEHTELLTAAGAEVVGVDPLRDEALPARCDALVIGGGFPEVHAAELSANAPLRRAVRDLAAAGVPIVGECAGLLYLSRSLDGAPMCGVLNVESRMDSRLTLGYRSAVAVSDGPLATVGTRVRGHEFHRTVCDPPHGDAAAWQWSSSGAEGFVDGSVHASYLHLHPAGVPRSVERFVRAAAAHRAAAVR